MAEQHYNPFSGYDTPATGPSYRTRTGKEATGTSTRMQPVSDWSSKTLVPGKWKIVDVNAIKRRAALEAGPAATTAAAARMSPLTPEETAAWREANAITVSADDCPAPLTDFAMLTMVPHYLQKKLTDQGFSAPTPIQAQAWPVLLSGRDFVGVAKTGSGKTLAFIVPALAHIAIQDPLRQGDGPLCVVLAPTRELAQQIEQETLKVLPQQVRCGCIYGGSPKGPQLGMLRQGIHILVATPGRLIDFLEIRRVNLLRVTYLVLDEADRMLDMGFEPQVRAICGQIRPDRQTLMFSATWPKEIRDLAASFQRNFVRVNIGSTELLANTDVAQSFVLTQEAAKLEELKKLLHARRNQRVLVFCKTKKTADYLEHQLKRTGVDAMAIHGDKEQRQREFILDRFRRDPRLCVVATDVAARGLDIKELETVINYDFPMQIDDYVHRIGRTGRAGAKGEAITLITKREGQLTPAMVRQLIGIVERAHQVAPEWMRQWAEEGGYHTVLKRNRNTMTGGAGFAGRRGAPVMRMPGGATYAHASSTASFDPRGNTAAPAAVGRFGLPPSRGGGAFANTAQYTRFASSEDEDEQPSRARHGGDGKRARHE